MLEREADDLASSMNSGRDAPVRPPGSSVSELAPDLFEFQLPTSALRGSRRARGRGRRLFGAPSPASTKGPRGARDARAAGPAL